MHSTDVKLCETWDMVGPYPSPAWSSVDVAAGSVEKGSKLPPGLLGPQCSACRVIKLKEVPYQPRDLAHLMPG